MKRKKLAIVLTVTVLCVMVFTMVSATRIMFNSIVNFHVSAINESEKDANEKEVFNDPDLCDNLKKISEVMRKID